MGTQIGQILENGPTDLQIDKRGKFVKLAEKRTINAIRAIRTIAKLGNKSHYEYDEKDVEKIVSALNKEVEALKVKMTSNGAKETVNFKL